MPFLVTCDSEMVELLNDNPQMMVTFGNFSRVFPTTSQAQMKQRAQCLCKGGEQTLSHLHRILSKWALSSAQT